MSDEPWKFFMNTGKVIWKSKILKNKSKDRDNNFLAMFSSSKA